MNKHTSGFMLEKIKNNFRVNYPIKKIMHFLLKTPLFTMNPVYKKLYYRNVRTRSQVLTQQLNTVMIEVTNYCNISCVFCPHSQMKRPKGFMKFELFKKIVDECKSEGVPNLQLYGMGEPLMDKNYFEKIRYASEKGIPNIECVTNAILLDREKVEALVDSGLTRLLVSIDAVTSDIYSSIHQTGGKMNKIEAIKENLIYLRDYRKRKGRVIPVVCARFREFSGNAKDLKLFKNIFAPITDSLKIDVNLFEWPGSSVKLPDQKLSRLIRFPCYNLWSQLYISHEGKVGLCCLDYEFKVKLGDVSIMRLRDIWNGDTLSNIRCMHLNGEFEKMPLCKSCLLNTQIIMPWWFH